MSSAEQELQKAQQRSAELAARLALRERLNAAIVEQLEREREEKQALADENSQLRRENSTYAEQVVVLKEDIAWLRKQVFGRSSEKLLDVSPDQRMLFNEAEILAAIEAADNAEQTLHIGAHERVRKKPPKVIPKEFPREPIEHDLPDAEKICPHDGTALQRIEGGAEVAERYRFISASVIVEQHIRYKYGCPCCRRTVKTAPPPAQLIPKSISTASLLASITTAKFVDGLPLTRQGKQWERIGLPITPATAGSWINTIGEQKVQPLIDLARQHLLAMPFIHCDETPVQVLKSEKSSGSDHYMIVQAAGPPGKRIVLFNYEPARNVETLTRLFTGPGSAYGGKLLTDGLELYDILAANLKLDHFGCLTHARRYFDTALKVTELPSGRSLARGVLNDFIGKVYRNERKVKEWREAAQRAGTDPPLEQILRIRQDESKPIMTALRKWLDEIGPGIPPTSALGKAISYCTNQWEKLVRFLDDPTMAADNNYLENLIRPFAVGRRSWLFCDTQRGARASANLYSLASMCRSNGIEPLAYFTYLYTHLPIATSAEQLDALLPWNVKVTFDRLAREKRPKTVTQLAA